MDIHISYHILVGGLEHLDYFSIDWECHHPNCGLEHEFYDYFHMLGIVTPTDQIIFFRGVGQPPTSISDGSPGAQLRVSLLGESTSFFGGTLP